MVDVSALVLAAGRGSRFASGDDDSKVYATYAGRPLVAHVAAAALASRATRVVVVTGHAAERAEAALRGLDVVLAHNPGFAEGLSGSIGAGLDALPRETEAAIMLLGDMPLVRSGTLDALIERYARERPDAVVPCRGGRRGNPVLLARSLFRDLGELRGDEGARRLMSSPRHRILEVEVDDPGIFADVDTREALAALQAARSAPGTT